MHTSIRQRILLGLSSVAVALAGVSFAVSSPAATPARQTATYSVPSFDKYGDPRNYYVSGTVAARGGEIHGVVFDPEDTPLLTNERDLPRMARDGINTIDVLITEYQKTGTSNRIFGGRYTPTAQQVKSVIRAAKRQHMAVEVMPLVVTSQGYVARKLFQPSRPHLWFASYRKMVDHWATVAQQAHADIFSVGSEYDDTVGYVTEWKSTIHSVRHRFHRRLTYMATGGSVLDVKFWRRLDLISLSPYYTLSSDQVPTVRALRRKWKPILEGQYGLYRQYGKPILWDELGYQSQVKTAYEPYQKRLGAPSEKAQANAYQAAIDVTVGKDWLKGVIFYRWDRPVGPASADISWTPVDKQAECVLAKSWAASSRNGVGGEPAACTQLSVLSSNAAR